MKLDREDWENALATLLIALTVSETSKIILKKKNKLHLSRALELVWVSISCTCEEDIILIFNSLWI